MAEPSTFIHQPDYAHKPVPLKADEAATLNAYYDKYGVKEGSTQEKNNVLMKAIQERRFFALGGQESEEIELRANERIFLMQKSGK